MTNLISKFAKRWEIDQAVDQLFGHICSYASPLHAWNILPTIAQPAALWRLTVDDACDAGQDRGPEAHGDDRVRQAG